MRILERIVIVLLLGLFSSCKQPSKEQDALRTRSLRVVTTTGMLADMAKDILGENGEVTALMGPGVDPHLYKATQSDLSRLQEADLIIYNGLHLEGKMGEILEKLERIPGKAIFNAGEQCDKARLISIDDTGQNFDPHIWFDVSLWSEIVNPLANSLTSLRPDLESDFKKRADSKVESLDSLHQWVKMEIESLPAEQRILITAHDAFEYFGRAYGIEVKGLQGISTLSEAGIRDVKELVDLIVERKIKAVFIESSVPVRDIEAVAAGCLERGHEVRIGGTLFSDAMGAEGTPEGTYRGMVIHNVRTMKEGLQ